MGTYECLASPFANINVANSSITTAFFLFFLLTLSLLYSLWHFTNYDISLIALL